MGTSKKTSTVQTVTDLAKPIIERLGLDLWDIRFEKEGASWYLRVLIDKEGGVNIDDCEALSRPLNEILDETDPIEQSYIFEVGSPGLGRDLKRPEHFEKSIGQEIRIGLYKAINGSKEVVGILEEYNNKEIVIGFEGENKTILLSDCSFVKLYDDKDLFE